MLGEKAVLVKANKKFFAIYTNKQLLHLFSSSTTQLIKRGILVEGVCMIQSNQNINKLALLTIKGQIYIYKIYNPDSPSSDSVKLEMRTSIQDILQQAQTQLKISSLREQAGRGANSQQIVHVQTLCLLDNENIDIFLSNQERYQYETNGLQQWRQYPKISALSNQSELNAGSNGDVRVEPHLANYEGPPPAGGRPQGSQNMFENNALSKLISVLDQANQDEPMQGLSLSQ